MNADPAVLAALADRVVALAGSTRVLVVGGGITGLADGPRR